MKIKATATFAITTSHLVAKSTTPKINTIIFILNTQNTFCHHTYLILQQK